MALSVWKAGNQSGNSPSEGTSTADRNYRTVIVAGSISLSGHKVRVLFSNTTGANTMRIDGASIGVRDGATDDFTATPIRLTFGGNNTVTVAAGKTQWSDWVNFNLDQSKDHMVTLHILAGAAWSQDIWADTGNTHYFDTTATDYTLTQTVTFTGQTNINGVGEIQVDNSGNIAGYFE